MEGGGGVFCGSAGMLFLCGGGDGLEYIIGALEFSVQVGEEVSTLTDFLNYFFVLLRCFSDL